jgi:hypothetical protein
VSEDQRAIYTEGRASKATHAIGAYHSIRSGPTEVVMCKCGREFQGGTIEEAERKCERHIVRVRITEVR